MCVCESTHCPFKRDRAIYPSLSFIQTTRANNKENTTYIIIAIIPIYNNTKPIKNNPGRVKETVEITIYRNITNRYNTTIYSTIEYPNPLISPSSHTIITPRHTTEKTYHIRNDLESTLKTTQNGSKPSHLIHFLGFLPVFVHILFIIRGERGIYRECEKLTCGKINLWYLPKCVFSIYIEIIHTK